MNGTVQNLKEAWQKVPGKTKKMIAVIAAGTIILAAAGLLVLNMGTKKRIQYLVRSEERRVGKECSR